MMTWYGGRECYQLVTSFINEENIEGRRTTIVGLYQLISCWSNTIREKMSSNAADYNESHQAR